MSFKNGTQAMKSYLQNKHKNRQADCWKILKNNKNYLDRQQKRRVGLEFMDEEVNRQNRDGSFFVLLAWQNKEKGWRCSKVSSSDSC